MLKYKTIRTENSKTTKDRIRRCNYFMVPIGKERRIGNTVV